MPFSYLSYTPPNFTKRNPLAAHRHFVLPSNSRDRRHSTPGNASSDIRRLLPDGTDTMSDNPLSSPVRVRRINLLASPVRVRRIIGDGVSPLASTAEAIMRGKREGRLMVE